jgi:TIR domain
MTWDYFITHASEDKLLVVAPLAHYLKTASFNTWYDDFCLNVGDSLSDSINKGLRESRFGVVTLSPDFFRKQWPQYELRELIEHEKAEGPRILPIWHHITAPEIAKFSPELADRKAADTRKGLQAVAEQLVQASFPDRVENLPLSNVRLTEQQDAANARQKLCTILETNPSPNDVFMFLSGYPVLVASIFGYVRKIIPGFKMPGPMQCEFASIVPHGVTGPVEVVFLRLGPIQYNNDELRALVEQIKGQLGHRGPPERRPFNDPGPPYIGQYESLFEASQLLQRLVMSQNIHWKNPETWCLKFLILCGRRSETPREARDEIRQISQLRLDIASYDRLLDDRDSIYFDLRDS